MRRITPKQVAKDVPVIEAMRSSVVSKRAKNNAPKHKGDRGLQFRVADNDPMAKDSQTNYP